MAKVLPALTLGVALLACGSTARAQMAAPTPVPDAKPDMSSMMFSIGTWNCHSTTRGSSRPDTIVFSMDYDGRWMKGHDVAPPFDKYRTRAIVSDTWMSYNTDAKVWIQTSVDNFGGYGISTSPGWKGNQITWTATVTPDGSTGSDTMTKDSDTKTTDVATGKDKNGKMQPTTTTVCLKT